MNEPQTSQPPQGGSKLSTIFLVVLGLHIVLIVAFSAYYLLKGDTSVESSAPIGAENTAPEAPEIDAAALPTQPVLETEQDTQAAAAPAPSVAPSILPMPSSNDPIWTRVPEPAERATKPASPAVPAPLPAAPVVRAPASAPAPVGVRRSHTVAKGDSLTKIARVHGVTVPELKTANGLSSDLIRIGQVLSIPGRSSAPAAKPPVATAPAPTAVSAATYTVAKGDTLWGIARKLGVSAAELARVNGLNDPSKLKIGTVLKVPGVAKQEMAAPVPVLAPARATDMAMGPSQG